MFQAASTSKKVLLSLGALGAAGAIAGLGTFATFTSTTNADHAVDSGTVVINLGATGEKTNRLNIPAQDVLPGDTIQRSVDLVSTSTDGLGSVALTTTAPTTTSLLNTDATDGLQMVITECPVPWIESGTVPAFTYTCSGTINTPLPSRAVIGSALPLTGLSVLTSGGTSHLRVTLTLPTSAGNTFQDKTSVINYQFDATQRSATNR